MELAYDRMSQHPTSPPIVAPKMAHCDVNTVTNPQQRETKDKDTDENKQAAAATSADAPHDAKQKIANTEHKEVDAVQRTHTCLHFIQTTSHSLCITTIPQLRCNDSLMT